nr:reverse transcriptase domain-containing protein [Tanacetum cinerariifolium]
MANTTPLVTTVMKPKIDPGEANTAPRVNIQELCEEYYEDILPIIMEKARHERLKDVHAMLDFGEGVKKASEALKNHTVILSPTPIVKKVETIQKETGPRHPACRGVIQAKKNTIETGRMKGAPECMRISKFMHGINNLELKKRLNEHVPKIMEEMMIATTAFRTNPRSIQIKGLISEPPPPMVTPVEKRNSNKFCDFHNDKGHSTDECMQLKKQIEEFMRAGKLSYLIKEIKLGREQPKTGRKEAAAKDKPMTIYMGIVTICSSLLILAECASIDTSSTIPREKKTRPANLTVPLHPNFPYQEVVVGGSLSDKGRTELCALLKKNLDIFAWQPSDMTRVPRSIAEHRLNIREGCPQMRQKKRDGSSCVDGLGAGLILTNPDGVEFTYALRFQFAASNNKAEYEALIANLRIATQIGVKNIQANVDSKLVANQVLGTYVAKEDNMIKYLEIAKGWLADSKPFQSAKYRGEVTTVIKEEGPTWMTELVNYLKEGILPGDEKEARNLRLKARQYELIERVLYKRSFLTPWLRCVGPLQAEYVMKEIHEGLCSMHAGPWPVFERAGEGQVPNSSNGNFTKWIEARVVATITGGQELVAMSKSKSKSKMMKYYNSRVRGVAFKPGDFVYRSNDGSHAVAGGKLRPNKKALMR